MLMLIMSATTTVFAYSDNSSADAKTIIESVKDIRYNVESGVNFRDYNALVSKASVNLKRYEEKYPADDKDGRINLLYGQVIEYYSSAGQVWNMGISSKYDILGADDLGLVFVRNPTLKSKLTPNGGRYESYYYKDVLHSLWIMASDFEKNINLN